MKSSKRGSKRSPIQSGENPPVDISNTENVVAYLFYGDRSIYPACRTYSGGLGVLAGDTLRSAADLGLASGCSHPRSPQRILSASISMQTERSRKRIALDTGRRVDTGRAAHNRDG